MADLIPEYLTYDYSSQFRGVPGAHHDPEDYPVSSTIIIGTVWDEDDDGGDGAEVTVGNAHPYLVADAGIIDLFVTLDAVNPEVAGVGEMLTLKRPDLIEDMALGGDLLIVSSLWIEPEFRGNKLGHAVLKAILGTIGRSAVQVILQAAPALADGAPGEGTPEHEAAKSAPRRLLGRVRLPRGADYLVLDDMADVLD